MERKLRSSSARFWQRTSTERSRCDRATNDAADVLRRVVVRKGVMNLVTSVGREGVGVSLDFNARFGASRRQARHTRNVTSSQPETVIVSPARAIGFSLVSLSHTAFGSGDDQLSLTCRSSPDAPNRRTIHAFPSSLGFSAVTSTSAGSTRNKWPRNSSLPIAGAAINGWLRPVAKRAAAAGSYGESTRYPGARQSCSL
jgi:hypothetical protein